MAAMTGAKNNYQGAGPGQWHADENVGHCNGIKLLPEAEIQAHYDGRRMRLANGGGPTRIVGGMEGGPRQAYHIRRTKRLIVAHLKGWNISNIWEQT